jgi:hypothetical protein
VKIHGTFRLLCSVLLIGTALAALRANQASSQTTESKRPPAFHENPPTEPLPTTVDPEEFRYNRAAFVAYALARRIRETLYQVPCYCHCDREAGHQSLLDCFTSKHGAMCTVCQEEVVFCHLQRGKGKSPAQIREAMAKGEAFRVNLDRYADRFYKQLTDVAR